MCWGIFLFILSYFLLKGEGGGVGWWWWWGVCSGFILFMKKMFSKGTQRVYAPLFKCVCVYAISLTSTNTPSFSTR